MNHSKVTLILLLIVSFSLGKIIFAQPTENDHNNFNPSKKFSVYLFSTYVSSAEVQNNIDSPDPIERAALTDIRGGFGFGSEFDIKPSFLNIDLVYYFSLEYLHINQEGIQYEYINGTNIVNYQARDKFSILPIELGIKWPLPVGTNNFKIYIGGGGGVYIGTHTRYVDNLTSQTTRLTPGFSLNVLAGLNYYIAKNIAANIELKFRDAAFDTQSKYNYITSLPNPFSTRVIVDGVRVSAGFKYDF